MERIKYLIKRDFEAFCRHYQKPGGNKTFFYFFVHYPEFRVLVKTRLKIKDRGVIKLMRLVIDATCRHINLFVYTEATNIGEGLVFHHGFSTMISAESIGENCHIYQQVTIGNSHGKTPIIGNNVTIYPGAKLFGEITIGDDVVIGANAVVTKDVPSHSMVVGIPAKRIKERNSEAEQWKKIM